MVGLVLLTMLIIHLLPRLTTAVSAPLIAIIAISLLVTEFNLDTRVVGDIASISGDLPSFHIPLVSFSWETLAIIFPYSAILAALVGVMFIVVLGTFEWSSLRIMRKIPRGDAFVLILVSAVTVISDLATAVIVGVIASALMFAWEHAKRAHIKRSEQGSSTLYKVYGPVFFASTSSLLEQFSPDRDRDDVVVDFAGARVCDHSGLEAIDTLAERYEKAGKTLHLRHLRHLSPECRLLLTKAGNLVEVNVLEDSDYFVADDMLG